MKEITYLYGEGYAHLEMRTNNTEEEGIVAKLLVGDWNRILNRSEEVCFRQEQVQKEIWV